MKIIVKRLPLLVRLLLISGVVIIFMFLIIPVPKPDNIPSSTVVLDRNGNILRVFLNEDEQFLYPMDVVQEVPIKIVAAITMFEDKHFFDHPGVNPIALLRAMKLNIKYGSIISGGSTITMQAVGLHRRRSRTYFNKILEILEAVKWEILYSKDTILKSYCNNAPYGSNIVGIRTASYKYYGRDLQQLTWAESALLAILPNNPGALYPGCNPEPLMEKRNNLLRRLWETGRMNEETYKNALREPIPNEIKSFPFHAPHLSDEINLKSKGETCHTTIDYSLQNQVELIAHRMKNRYNNLGIKNFSILVTERKSGKIRAYLGSQDFRDSKTNGQVNGVTANRSTGSILKPFLYAASIDEGLILPQTLLTDTKLHYMLFAPENYDTQYRGIVTAKNALRKSLNIPAVRLLEQYGVFQFYNLLKDAGLPTLFRSYDEYGLSLIIGGAEASLIDVTNLYLQLANTESIPKAHYVIGKDREFARDISISKGAKWLTLEMLKNNNFTPLEVSGKKPIAVKTGTSFGNRDAWATGVTTDWVISVWAGNFTGESNPEILSFTAAVPLLKSVYRILPDIDNVNWFYMPEASMRKQEICEETGYYPGPNCEHTIEILIPDEAKPMQSCPYHKKLSVDIESGYSVCSHCWNGKNVKQDYYLEFPPSVTAILKTRNSGLKLAPSHNPDCPVSIGYTKPEILYPVNNSKVLLPSDFGDKKQKVVLKASHSNLDIKLFWYLDNEPIGETVSKHTLSITPEQGKHTLKVVDNNGSSSSVSFSIQ